MRFQGVAMADSFPCEFATTPAGVVHPIFFGSHGADSFALRRQDVHEIESKTNSPAPPKPEENHTEIRTSTRTSKGHCPIAYLQFENRLAGRGRGMARQSLFPRPNRLRRLSRSGRRNHLRARPPPAMSRLLDSGEVVHAQPSSSRRYAA